jgi:DNA polymerase-3 subunit epsilon
MDMERLQSDRLAAIGKALAWLEPGQETPVVILDTETTGLHGAQMCDLAIINAKGETLFSSLVKPTIPIPGAASAVHHITDEMVQHAPTCADVWPAVRGLLRGSLVVTYNAQYDKGILIASLAAHRIPTQLGDLGMAWRCAMKLYAQFYGDWDVYRASYRWQKLGLAAEQCGIAVNETLHHALADTRLTLAVLTHIAAQAKASPVDAYTPFSS